MIEFNEIPNTLSQAASPSFLFSLREKSASAHDTGTNLVLGDPNSLRCSYMPEIYNVQGAYVCIHTYFDTCIQKV